MTLSVDGTITRILAERTRIIEEFLAFWLAASVPDADMTPEWIAKNLILCERPRPGHNEYWVRLRTAEDIP